MISNLIISCILTNKKILVPMGMIMPIGTRIHDEFPVVPPGLRLLPIKKSPHETQGLAASLTLRKREGNQPLVFRFSAP